MTTPAPHTSDEIIHFPSMAALRAAHSELLKRLRGLDNIANITLEAEMFIRRGKATGSLLDTDADRWEAQSKLDYWATQIYQPGYEPPDAILDEFDPELAPAIDDGLCPYMGLDAFQEANQSVFFGRERLVSELIDRLRASRFLAVLGPSGSGKSSLVRAGLIPELKKGALSGSADWTYLPPMVPGSNPLQNLARLMTDAEDPVRIALEADGYRDHPGYLAQTASETVRGSVVLVVDQFEEIFTLCTDEIARSRFVENLVNLCQTPGIDHYVIITMRSDFEMNIVRLPALEAAFEQNAVRITPLAASELRESIEAPAERIGLKFEEGVVNSLVSDTLGEPAALPLLQFTLLKLWEKREHNRITRDAYQKLGGGRQALARSADEFYKQLIPEEQTTMRRILLKMVRPGEGLEVTSNRVPRAYLYQKAEANDRIDRVLDRLIRARLIRKSQGDMVMDDQLEIAHEALIRNWPTLVEWLDEERVKLRQRHRLTTAAEEWQRLNRATSALWRRELLQEALRYDDLNELERQFVNASNTRQRFVRTARITGAIVLVAYLLIAAFFYKRQSDENAQLAAQNANIAQTAQAASLMANEQRRIAEENANEAQTQAKLALASRLVSQAQLIMETQKSNQTVGLLLAIESIHRSPLPEAARILQNNPLPGIVARLDHEDGVNTVAFSPDGRYIASGSENNVVRVFDVKRNTETTHMLHDAWVTKVAFSPDGQYVVSGSSDSTARVWEVVTGTEVSRMTHDDWVYAVAFSPDGQYVVSGSDDGTARVWEAATGAEVARMTHDDYVNTVAFSPDGQYVVSGSSDSTARVWEAITGSEIARMTHDDWVIAVAFGPDGQHVVSGSDDGTARVWEAATGAEVARISHAEWINTVAFSPDGQYVASGSYDDTARVWEATTGRQVASVSHGSPVWAIAFSPDGRFLVSGSDNGVALITNVTTGDIVASMSHDGEVRTVAFSSDGLYVASGVCDVLGNNDESLSEFCYQGKVQVWESTLRNSGVTSMPHEDWVRSVAFSPDGRYVASGSDDGTARVWEVASGTEISRMTHNDWVKSVAISPDGRYVASGSDDGTARVWELTSGREIARMTHDHWIFSVAFSPDGHYVASADYGGVTNIWEANSGDELLDITAEGTSLLSVTFSQDGRYVASGGCEEFGNPDDSSECTKGSIKVYEFDTGTEVLHKTHIDWVRSVAFSPDGRYVASGSDDGTARVWELASGREIARMTHSDWVRSVAFSPDGRYVASGSDDGTARVWELTSGREIARMTHNGSVTAVSFSPDGKYVVSSSDDGTARVWEGATGTEAAHMLHSDAVRSVAFSPDGQYVVSGGVDKTVRVWTWRSQDFIQITCSRLSRNLTSTEWKQYLGEEPYRAPCNNLPVHPTVIADSIYPILLDSNDPERVQKAVQTVRGFLPEHLETDRAETQAIKLVNSAILSQLYDAGPDLDEGIIEPTLVLLEDAQINGLEIDDPDVLNNACWLGTIYGYAKEMLPYCEQAVELAPDDAAIRDSRGLARALTGDYPGAIEDFQAFIDSGEWEEYAEQRRGWIKSLEAGNDPFTQDELETLKEQ